VGEEEQNTLRQGVAVEHTHRQTGEQVEDEGIELVKNYMSKANRPYNAKLVFDNTHAKDIGLSQAKVTKILDDLVKDEILQSKDFSKKLLYWANQTKFDGALDQSSLKELDEKFAKLTQEEKELSSKVTTLETENKQLTSEPTDKDIDKILSEAKTKHSELNSRLDKIRASDGGKTDGKQKAKLEEKYNKTKKEWRSRKRKFNEIMDTIEESMDAKKFKSMKDDMGIETDEDAGIKIDNDKTTQFKARK